MFNFSSNDRLDLTFYDDLFSTLDDVLAASSETADGLLIDLGNGNSILLDGADLTTLTADNLLLI